MPRGKGSVCHEAHGPGRHTDRIRVVRVVYGGPSRVATNHGTRMARITTKHGTQIVRINDESRDADLADSNSGSLETRMTRMEDRCWTGRAMNRPSRSNRGYSQHSCIRQVC
jgi:hypothetical protein